LEVKSILKTRLHGEGFPLTIAVVLVLLIIFSAISEYFKVNIITQGVRDAVQQAVIATVNDNYDDVYHAVREGYAAGFTPDSGSWSESLDSGNVYANLRNTLGLVENGSGYVKYAGEAVEYILTGLEVELTNNPLASGESEGFLADATVRLEVPMGFAGSLLPPLKLTLKVQAKYIPKF
jgi:hypothetical protein